MCLIKFRFFYHFLSELPDVLMTEMWKCNWLFFKKPHSVYKQIRLTKMKWKLNRRNHLYISGIPHATSWLLWVLSRQSGTIHEENVINLARQWTFHLYECMGFSLYCMSSEGQVEIKPQVVKIKRNKSLGPPSLQNQNPPNQLLSNQLLPPWRTRENQQVLHPFSFLNARLAAYL